jgi:uncharacterized surface protein with fasciclin (FAS1) repeats
MKKLNVIDTAIRTGIFQTFTRLLEGSLLEKRLRSAECLTLFAPIDISFAYLSPETLDRLLRAENQGLLSDVLSYHAIPGKILSSELKDLGKTPTNYGLQISVDTAGQLRVSSAKLIHPDIVACNGVIHGIDRLLMPAKSVAAASR